ncbi:hypothetical protein B0H16DRAFT_1370420, partial [Mycena metata]
MFGLTNFVYATQKPPPNLKSRLSAAPNLADSLISFAMRPKSLSSAIARDAATPIWTVPGETEFGPFRRSCAFKEEIQKSAANLNQWHLYAIYQHSVNSGGVSWQTAIHSLVVEAIRRDEAGNFDDHKYLGRALNGLLPRRAHVDDLGRGGWNDLAWLLELNQGFYNAANLAALCSLPDHSSVSWLGKPIHPMPGNERLEPIVTALPVPPSTANPSAGCPPLMIIGGEMISLRPRFRRDWAGLYNN